MEHGEHGVAHVTRTHLARFIGISERCGRVLSPDMATSLYQHGTTFCKRYVALSQEATRSAMGGRMEPFFSFQLRKFHRF